MRDKGGERAGRNSWVQAVRPPRHFLRFGPMIGTFELSLEREPKTDERRTANDGPLSILSLSRIVPRSGGGRFAEGERGVASLKGDEWERAEALLDFRLRSS